MFSSLKNMFKVPDLRNKIFFTLFIIAVYRLGANVTVPGVSFAAVKDLESQSKTGVLGFLNLFSGGALTRIAVFALGIMPYITSSIIMQLLAVVIPKIEQWQKQGAVGQKKITQWTRYMTVGLAILQATGIAYQMNNGILFGRGGTTQLPNGESLIPHFDVPHVALIVLTITAGTAVVMWMGELVTQRGVGNGMSILIFTNVVSTMPAQFANIKATAGFALFTVVMIMGLAMIVAIVFVEQGQRRIPVQFAKRQVGRRMYGGQSTYIPLKVNSAGVIPIIFASSVLYFPVLLSNVIQWKGISNFINNNLLQPDNFIYITIYGPADHLLHLLLHGHHLRPAPAGRPHQESRVGSSPASGPVLRPSATWVRSSTASPCRARCSSPPSPSFPRSSSRSGACRTSRSGARRS